MKTLILLSLCISLCFSAKATEIHTVNVTTPGTLSTLAGTYLTTVTDLIVTGVIDARDFKTMRDNMPLLSVVDLEKATIAAYTGTDGTGKKDNIYSYPANELAQYAFCTTDYKGKISLTSVIMPVSATSIGDIAFYGCKGLTGSLILPDSLISIGEYAFAFCKGLTGSTILPDSLTSIGDQAFESCSRYTSVYIPASVRSIGGMAFYGCSGLGSIYTYRTKPVDLFLKRQLYQNITRLIQTLCCICPLTQVVLIRWQKM